MINDQDENAETKRREKEREERAEAAIRERTKQVAESHSEVLKEREKERAHHARDEAMQMFAALLLDVIKSPLAPEESADAESGGKSTASTATLSWKQAKKQLRGDSRYRTVADSLSKGELESIFKKHLVDLRRKHRDLFFRLLNDLSSVAPKDPNAPDSDQPTAPRITLTSDWRDVKRALQDETRFSKIAIPQDEVLEEENTIFYGPVY